MPAYNFQERFVPFVADGSKPHTIRKRRVKQTIEVGKKVYLYSGLRTKHAKLIALEECTDVRTIKIWSGGIFICKQRLDDYKFDLYLNSKYIPLGHSLSQLDRNILAWKDGFRPEGSSLANPDGCFDLMFRFWRQTHALPFFGDIVRWEGTFDSDAPKVRRCCVCGCTDDDCSGCIKKTGRPCHWVANDLCSACA